MKNTETNNMTTKKQMEEECYSVLSYTISACSIGGGHMPGHTKTTKHQSNLDT